MKRERQEALRRIKLCGIGKAPARSQGFGGDCNDDMVAVEEMTGAAALGRIQAVFEMREECTKMQCNMN